jgi:hypothetical protein
MLRRLLLLCALVALPLTAAAQDLEDFFPGLVSEIQANFAPVIVIEGGPDPGTFPADPGQFIDGLFDPSAALGNVAEEVASQFQRVPVGSTVAAFTFEFDTNLNVFTRSTEGLGPLASERAQTTGKGKLNVAFSYSYVDFKVFEGDDLDDIGVSFSGTAPFTALGESGDASYNYASGGGFASIQADVPFGPGRSINFTPEQVGSNIFNVPGLIVGSHTANFDSGRVVSAAVDTTLDASMTAHTFAFFANYGITDRIDAGIVVPLLQIDLEGRVRNEGLVDPSGLPIGGSTTRKQDDKFGLGDITARLKANLWESDYVDLGARGDVILPTGDDENFMGYGDIAFAAMGIASKNFKWVAPHVNAGFLLRVNDVHGHAFRWAVGADIQPETRVTFSGDFVGEAKLDPDGVGDEIYGASAGIKFNVWRRLVLAGNALVRLNSQGLRADVIPSGTIEYTFF